MTHIELFGEVEFPVECGSPLFVSGSIREPIQHETWTIRLKHPNLHGHFRVLPIGPGETNEDGSGTLPVVLRRITPAQ